MNDSHSKISEFPINYEQFPLAKNCVMHKVELYSGQYITIPSLWFHWVITEPNTLAISYRISLISFDNDDDIYTSFSQSIPLVKTTKNNNISYYNFITKSLKNNYEAIFSLTNDCSPVNKNNSIKFFYNSTLENIISITKHKKYYSYIGNHYIYDNDILFNYKNINNVINLNYSKIDYKTTSWFTLDKQVDSGLHHDPTHNILYIVSGKKTIYLFHPKYKENLYIENYNLISII